MIVALYVIGSTFGLLLVSARLREAHAELARMRAEYDRDRAVREEYGAYARGVAVTLACVLAGLAAASWYPPPCPSARRAPGGRAGASAGTPAGGPGQGAAG
jgi:hypothetical protein